MPLAPCGLDCDACSLKPEQCDGCHAQSDHLWHDDCAMRVCCLFQKQHDNCSCCDDFPCRHIDTFNTDQWAHHKAAVRKLHELRVARGGVA